LAHQTSEQAFEVSFPGIKRARIPSEIYFLDGTPKLLKRPRGVLGVLLNDPRRSIATSCASSIRPDDEQGRGQDW